MWPHSDFDMYRDGHMIAGAPKPPLNPLDALRAYEEDEGLQRVLGTAFSAANLKLKHQEWNTYCAQFTAREQDTRLDI
jgi:glutamine synthetase